MQKLSHENCHSLLRLIVPITILALICFAFLPLVGAVTPAPDGGYAGANTAEGTNSLFSLTTGVWNTASGFETLKNDTTGSVNTATGFGALSNNLSGNGNTAVGSRALVNNNAGDRNIAVGANSGLNITTGSFNIDIGNVGTAADNKTIRIGSAGNHDFTFIAGITGVPLPDGVPVVVRGDGQLGIASISSARFKEEIEPMDKASEAILALKPVTFRYKRDIDPQGMPQFGLVAEEVAKVNPNLVTRDPKGELYTVRYEAVNAMLLNEFLKEHRKVEELQASRAEHAKEIKALNAALKEQAAQIQKVSAQLQMSRPAPQVTVSK
jgi:hypothetical protein